MTPEQKARMFAKECFEKCPYDERCYDYCMRMYEWTKQQLVNEVIEWLSNNVNNYIVNDKQNVNERDWLKVKSDCFNDLRKHIKLLL